jgi:N-carbamoylputrescine amidase
MAGVRSVTLGLLQHACGSDRAANLSKALHLAEKAVKAGAQIICTQELFLTPYFCQTEDYKNFDLAEDLVTGGFELVDGYMHINHLPGFGITKI